MLLRWLSSWAWRNKAATAQFGSTAENPKFCTRNDLQSAHRISERQIGRFQFSRSLGRILQPACSRTDWTMRCFVVIVVLATWVQAAAAFMPLGAGRTKLHVNSAADLEHATVIQNVKSANTEMTFAYTLAFVEEHFQYTPKR